MLLALDLSLSTGWALGNPNGGCVLSGVWKLGHGDDGAYGRPLSCLAQSLETVLAHHKPRLVVFEAPINKQQTSMRVLFYLAGVVEMICWEHDVRCREANVMAVRKAVLGHGRPENPKAAVMAWARSQGFDPPGHDAADALLLWRHACMQGGGRIAA